MTFTHKGKEYEVYDQDGFRPLAIMDSDGNDCDDLDVYEVACQSLLEGMYEKADIYRKQQREGV